MYIFLHLIAKAVLIHSNVPVSVNHFEADSNGCYVLFHGILLQCNIKRIRILCVYAAPDIVDLSFLPCLTCFSNVASLNNNRWWLIKNQNKELVSKHKI